MIKKVAGQLSPSKKVALKISALCFCIGMSNSSIAKPAELNQEVKQQGEGKLLALKLEVGALLNTPKDERGVYDVSNKQALPVSTITSAQFMGPLLPEDGALASLKLGKENTEILFVSSGLLGEVSTEKTAEMVIESHSHKHSETIDKWVAIGKSQENTKQTRVRASTGGQDDPVSKTILAGVGVTALSDSKKKINALSDFIASKYKVGIVEARQIVESVIFESEKKNINPSLTLSIIAVESGFNKSAKSHVGASGLTQVMPHIHRDKISKHGVNIWSINGNIKIGTEILAEYIKSANGNVVRALQMYNGSSKDKTLKYSRKVISLVSSFEDKAKHSDR